MEQTFDEYANEAAAISVAAASIRTGLCAIPVKPMTMDNLIADIMTVSARCKALSEAIRRELDATYEACPCIAPQRVKAIITRDNGRHNFCDHNLKVDESGTVDCRTCRELQEPRVTMIPVYTPEQLASGWIAENQKNYTPGAMASFLQANHFPDPFADDGQPGTPSFDAARTAAKSAICVHGVNVYELDCEECEILAIQEAERPTHPDA